MMLEVIKTIVEILAKGVEGLGATADLRDKKKKRKIGAELALLYLELCRIIATAREIVSSLEVYVQRMGDHLQNGTDSYALTGGNWIRRKVETQRVNVGRLGRSAQRLQGLLNLVQPESYTALNILIRSKVNALDSVSSLLAQGKISLSEPESGKLEEILHSPNSFEDGSGEMYHAKLQARHEIKQYLIEKTVSTMVPWDAEVYISIQDYLEKRSPRQVIVQLQYIAEKLRTALETHFTLADILIDVQDQRNADGAEELLW